MTAARDDRSVRRYLLGELPEEEADRFEREYFESDSAFDDLVAAENELIDAHLAGRMTPGEEAAFARHFLSSPERQERVAFARALLHTAARAAPAAPPLRAFDAPRVDRTRARAWLGWVAALLCGVAVGWSVERTRSQGLREAGAAADEVLRQETALREALAAQRAQLESAQRELARTREQLERVEGAASALAPAGRFVAVLLQSGLQRDAAPRPSVVVPAGTSELRLRLVVPPDPYRSYAASIETAEGRPVASRAGLSADRSTAPSAVELRLDARSLVSGEYVVTVRGLGRDGVAETIGDYAFRLRRD